MQVTPGIFLGAHEAAVAEVMTGGLQQTDFRFFAGCLAWEPGQLQREIAAGAWHTAACSRSLVLKQCLQVGACCRGDRMQVRCCTLLDGVRRTAWLRLVCQRALPTALPLFLHNAKPASPILMAPPGAAAGAAVARDDVPHGRPVRRGSAAAAGGGRRLG